LRGDPGRATSAHTFPALFTIILSTLHRLASDCVCIEGCHSEHRSLPASSPSQPACALAERVIRTGLSRICMADSKSSNHCKDDIDEAMHIDILMRVCLTILAPVEAPSPRAPHRSAPMSRSMPLIDSPIFERHLKLSPCMCRCNGRRARHQCRARREDRQRTTSSSGEEAAVLHLFWHLNRLENKL
jgi:hypothetical protein